MSPQAMRATDGTLRLIWIRLEEIKNLPPLSGGRCRYCGSFHVTVALCEECEARRMRLAERFREFPTPETVDESEPPPMLAARTERRLRLEPRREWTPYKDEED